VNSPKTIPKHIAIIMDGNGRWARNKNRPRNFGHKAGAQALRTCIKACNQLGVGTLTVFAFSSENWNRPKKEVAQIMELFIRSLDRETPKLHQNDICLRFIGDKSIFKDALQEKMQKAESLTRNNCSLVVNIAVNFSGRWDITQSAKRLIKCIAEGKLSCDDINEDQFASFLSLCESPAPELIIRTGEEMRISNFLLWEASKAELYFTPTLWPDFDSDSLGEAVAAFQA
jgi:undecaprenyl diphosphate synthase